MKRSVTITDVGPRDGLQNQTKILSLSERLQIIQALGTAGVDHIEVGAFVSPKVVPAMANTESLVSALSGDAGTFSVLIPNMKGYELATRAGADTVVMVLYGTDGMAQANVNQSKAEVEAVTEQILVQAVKDKIDVLATIAVSFECPFDGPVAPETILEIADRFLAKGASQIVIADTIGAANPAQVRTLMDQLIQRHGEDRIACHFHDTRAMGLANVFAAIESGVRSFDSSIGGLGGCPFAPGASGNVATEDVVMMVEQMGFNTGIDQLKLAQASSIAAKLTGSAPGGRAKPWLNRQLGLM
ncbi:MAG: hydroxymethylglutaryl-CoA lyase [Lysobacterales bacterium]|jgi:hydroxymethylglutaryl-CoA lyase